MRSYNAVCVCISHMMTTAKATEYVHRDVRFHEPYYQLNRFLVTGGDEITCRHGQL